MSIRRSLALAVLFAAGAASAQPKPALVQDRDTAARDPLQVTRASVPIACTSDSCSISFADFTVPAGKRLVITQLWVNVDGSNPNPNGFVAGLTDPPGTSAIAFDAPGRPSGATRLFQPLVFYVEAGRFPLVSVGANDNLGGMSAVVTLTGHWITLP